MKLATSITGLAFGFSFVTICYAVPAIVINMSGQTKGSPSTLACRISGFPISGTAAWYKASSSSATGNQVLLCSGTSCLISVNGDRYTYIRNGTGMYLTIKQLARTTDQGWWRCVLQSANPNVQKYEYLNVYTPPGGVTYKSQPTEHTDLRIESFSIACKTLACSYPNPTFKWYYLDRSTRIEYGSGQVTESSTGCTDQERIFTSTLTTPPFSVLPVLPGNGNSTVSFVCGVKNPITDWLFTAASQTVRFTVPAVHITIEGTTKGLSSTLACGITEFPISGTTALYRASSQSDPGSQIILCAGTVCLPSGNAERYIFNRNVTGMFLTFKQLDRSLDQGWWRCVLQSVNPTVQEYAYLNAYSPPGGVSYNNPPTGPTDLGVDSFSIQCRTDQCSYPQPTFKWFYLETGVRMEYSGGRQQGTESSTGCTDSDKIFSSTLTIPKFTVFQDHLDKIVPFICGMHYPSTGWIYTAASQTVRFAFKPDAEIRIGNNQDTTYNIQEHMSVALTCYTVPGNPNPSSYTWKKDNKTINGSTGVLHMINPVTRGDDGFYVCMADNGAGNSSSQSVHLNVQFAPEITSLVVTGATVVTGTPTTYEATEGASITMTCNVESNPTATVQWTKSGSATSDRIQAECANTAVPFICTATNPIGSTSTTFRLYVKCYPRINPSVPVTKEVYGDIGGYVQMTIHVIAYPPPTFTWRKLSSNGTEDTLPESAHLTDRNTSSTVILTNLQADFFGNYTVTVSNEVNTEPPFKYQFQVLEEVEPTAEPDNTSRSSSLVLVVGVGIAGIVLGCVVTLIVVKYHAIWRQKLCREPLYAEAKPNTGEHTYSEVERGASSAVALEHVSSENMGKESGPTTYENLSI